MRLPSAFRLQAASIGVVLAAGGPALAGSVAQPGSSLGLPVGTTRPAGLYFENLSSYGERTASPSGLGVNLTQVVWATPFDLAGFQPQFFFLQPTIYRTNTGNDSFYPNSTYFAGRLARKLGGGFGFSYQAGFRAAQPSPLAFRQSSLDQRLAVTYKSNDWMFTANLLNGLFFGNTTTYPNWLNLDLTALRSFGKLQIGAVAFGSTDISQPNPFYRRQGQIGVGGLVAYDFGPFALQAYVTRDVARRAYPGYETRGWTRLVVPLYKYETAAMPPVSTRY